MRCLRCRPARALGAYPRWIWLLVVVILAVLGSLTFSHAHAGTWLLLLILGLIPLRIVTGILIPPWLEAGKQRSRFPFLLWYVGYAISIPLFVLAMGWFHVLTGGSQDEIREFLVDTSMPLALINSCFLLDSSKSFFDVCGVILANSFFYAVTTFVAWRGVRTILKRNRVTAMNIESKPDPEDDGLD